MTVNDGIKIVTGNKTAATDYLKSKTYNKLISLYKPKVSSALNKPLVLNISANKAWGSLTGAYNKVGSIPNKTARLVGKKEPFPKVEVDLATYATEKALDGLFIKIAEEESLASQKLKFSFSRQEYVKQVKDFKKIYIYKIEMHYLGLNLRKVL